MDTSKGILELIGDLTDKIGLRFDKIRDFTSNPIETFKRFFKDEVRSIKTLARRQIMYYPVIVSDSCDFEMSCSVRTAIEAQCAVLSKIAVESAGVVRLDQPGEGKEELLRRITPQNGTYQFWDEENQGVFQESVKIFNHPIEVLHPIFEDFNKGWEYGRMDDAGFNMKPADLYFDQKQLIALYEANPYRGTYAKRPASAVGREDRYDFADYQSDLRYADAAGRDAMQQDRDDQQRNWHEQENEKQRAFITAQNKERIEAQAKESELNRKARNESERNRAQLQRDLEATRINASRRLEASKRNFQKEMEERRFDKEKKLIGIKAVADISAAKEKEKARLEFKRDDDYERNFERGRVTAHLATIRQKINLSEPTVIQCEIQWVNKYTIETGTFSFAVKSPMHVVPSSEVISFLPRSRYEGKFIIKLAKLFSGEIGFFKEFLLNIDSIKSFFDKSKAGQNKWYAKLKRIGSKNGAGRVIGETICPTASLVVSMNDIDEIYRVSNGKINFMDAGHISDLMFNLGLLNFIVIDEAGERVLWYEETEKSFNVIPAAMLENETKGGISKKDTMKMVLAASKAR